MQTWSGYSLSDFLLFSPRVYERLFVLLNQDLWPAQAAFIATGLAIFLLVLRRHTLALPLGLLALSFAWANVTIVFFLGRYQAINWLGTYLAPFAMVQAAGLLLLAIATWRRGVLLRPMPHVALWLALIPLLLGLLAYPAVAVLSGRGIEAGQVIATGADPTAVATLGLLAFVPSRLRWLGMIIPAAWCGFTGLTLWLLERPDAIIAPLAAVSALLAATLSVRSASQANAD